MEPNLFLRHTYFTPIRHLSVHRLALALVWLLCLTGAALAPFSVAASAGAQNIVCTEVTEIPVAECDVLLILYNNMGGPGWTTRTGWTDTLTPCAWFGVTCFNGRVAKLELFSNNLLGNLPPEIGVLTGLTVLDLHRNTLNGALPATLGGLTELRILRLDENQFNSEIPSTLGNLVKLTELNLENNALVGELPPTLGNLTLLRTLRLSRNALRGELPVELGAMTSLQFLYLPANTFTGTLPSQLSNLSDLRYLILAENQLSGELPLGLGSYTKLVRLSIDNNAFSGSIPASLGGISTLQHISLNNNQLSGALPAAFGGLTSLVQLHLNANPQLTGTLPITLTNLVSLTHFNFAATNLCAPPATSFQGWLNGVAHKTTSGLTCPTVATPTPTATDTVVPTPSPTPTATATPDPAQPYEQNNVCAQASTIVADQTVQTHNFYTAGDVDWVQFAATATTSYRIEVQIPPDSPADVALELYTNCADIPAANWNASFSPGVRLDFQSPITGTLYLRMTNVDANVAGAAVTYRLSVRPLSATSTGALILIGGRLRLVDPLQTNIHNVTNAVYKLFQANNYTKDDIYYLATDANVPGWDASATLANLRAAITTWACDKVGGERALTIYLIDHGAIGELYIDEPNRERLTPALLNEWLTELETAVPGVKINIIIEACNAGSFIAGTQSISKANRVIITSTNLQNLAYASATGAHFSDHFITALYQGHHLFASFWEAQTAVRRVLLFQEPWLDADGNGVANEASDEAVAAQRGFGYGAFGPDVWPPYIATASALADVSNRRATQATIQATVEDDKQVRRVWAVIYPPSYQPPPNSNELVPEALPTIVLQTQGDHQYAAKYTGFDELGSYTVVIHAEDDAGLEARPFAFKVSTGSQLFLPLAMR